MPYTRTKGKELDRANGSRSRNTLLSGTHFLGLWICVYLRHRSKQTLRSAMLIFGMSMSPKLRPIASIFILLLTVFTILILPAISQHGMGMQVLE